MADKELETLRFEASTAFWFNSNFNLLSTVLKLMPLPRCPNPDLSVITSVFCPFTLLFTATAAGRFRFDSLRFALTVNRPTP